MQNMTYEELLALSVQLEMLEAMLQLAVEAKFSAFKNKVYFVLSSRAMKELMESEARLTPHASWVPLFKRWVKVEFTIGELNYWMNQKKSSSKTEQLKALLAKH